MSSCPRRSRETSLRRQHRFATNSFPGLSFSEQSLLPKPRMKFLPPRFPPPGSAAAAFWGRVRGPGAGPFLEAEVGPGGGVFSQAASSDPDSENPLSPSTFMTHEMHDWLGGGGGELATSSVCSYPHPFFAHGWSFQKVPWPGWSGSCSPASGTPPPSPLWPGPTAPGSGATRWRTWVERPPSVESVGSRGGVQGNNRLKIGKGFSVHHESATRNFCADRGGPNGC